MHYYEVFSLNIVSKGWRKRPDRADLTSFSSAKASGVIRAYKANPMARI